MDSQIKHGVESLLSDRLHHASENGRTVVVVPHQAITLRQ